MRQKSATPNSPSERLVKSIRRATRKQYSAEEKIRIVLDGLRGMPWLGVLMGRRGGQLAAQSSRLIGVHGPRRLRPASAD